MKLVRHAGINPQTDGAPLHINLRAPAQLVTHTLSEGYGDAGHAVYSHIGIAISTTAS